MDKQKMFSTSQLTAGLQPQRDSASCLSHDQKVGTSLEKRGLVHATLTFFCVQEGSGPSSKAAMGNASHKNDGRQATCQQRNGRTRIAEHQLTESEAC